MSGHVWFYRRSTLMNEYDEGPFSDEQMVALAKRGTLFLDTLIRSPTRTKNQWIFSEHVPAIAVAINQSKLDTAEAKKLTIEAGKARKAEAEVARERVAVERKIKRAQSPPRLKLILPRTKYIAGASVAIILLLVACFFLIRSGEFTSLQTIVSAAFPSSMTTEEIVASAGDSIAKVRGSLGQGTGFMISPRLLVTNRHVTDHCFDYKLVITFPSVDKDKRLRGKIIYDDPDLDVAFIELESEHPPILLAPPVAFSSGGEVTVIGNPSIGMEATLDNAVARGIISTKTTMGGHEFYQLSISINPGNSGGPALDRQGRALGIVTLKATQQEGIAFCIPSEHVAKALEIAVSLPAGEKALRSFQHNVRAMVELIAAVSQIHLEALAKRVDKIKLAVDLEIGRSYGIKQSEDEAEAAAMIGDIMIIESGESFKVLVASEFMTEPVRLELGNALSNLKNIRESVSDASKYTSKQYRAKFDELLDVQRRSLEALRMLTAAK